MFLKIMKILCIEEILLFLKKCFKSFNQKDNLIFKIESIQNNYHKNKRQTNKKYKEKKQKYNNHNNKTSNKKSNNIKKDE